MRTGPIIVTMLLSVGVVSCASTTPTTSPPPLTAEVSHEFDTSEALGASVAGITLPEATAEGAPFRFVAEPGGVLVVYFGYTSCPDVCPTTLSDLRTALTSLGPDAAQVQVAMATVDPERDTDDVVTKYLHVFIPDGHALRTVDDAELREAADAFGVRYSVTKAAGVEPEVEHSAYLFAVDDAGVIQRRWFFGEEPATMADDLRTLLASG